MKYAQQHFKTVHTTIIIMVTLALFLVGMIGCSILYKADYVRNDKYEVTEFGLLGVPSPNQDEIMGLFPLWREMRELPNKSGE